MTDVRRRPKILLSTPCPITSHPDANAKLEVPLETELTDGEIEGEATRKTGGQRTVEHRLPSPGSSTRRSYSKALSHQRTSRAP